MPVNFRAQLGRFVLPLCLILTSLASCAFYSHATQFTPTEDVLTTSSIIDQNSDYEAWMQAKAERVLVAFGESSPIAIVSVELKMDTSETEVFTPNPNLTAVESVQKTQEVFKKKPSGELMDKTITETFEPGYQNTKKAEGFLVGQTKTRTVRLHPKLGKVSCLIFVSEENTEHRQAIETAVAVALGLEFKRGDTVLAAVR